MSFFEVLTHLPVTDYIQKIESATKEQVRDVLSKTSWNIEDFPVLLSKSAQGFIEEIAQKSHQLTKQRFGNTMQLFVPMYLSNVCYNKCTYCGFSVEHKYPRTTLTDEEIIIEADILQKKGFQHLLLLTGEAPGVVGVDYISNAVKLVAPKFASIGIEVQPLSYSDYKLMMESGVDSLTLYQETYHQGAYAQYHLAGKKKNYTHRLQAVEEGAKAGFYRINIGALLGLYEWQYEAIVLAHHVAYMQKHYWKSKYSISLPRIQKMVGIFEPKYTVSDLVFVQLICAFRLVFPDIGITLSTRETAALRDHLLPLGITTISAESKTEPGGYSGKDAEEQFETSDHRPLTEIITLLHSKGYDPIAKDWEPV